MKTKLLILTAFLLAIQRLSAQTGFGQSENWNADWLFLQADDTTALAPNYDDSRWLRLDLPHDWSVEQPMSPDLASCTGYLPGGIGWYRKHFRTDDLDGKKLYVYFEGVYNRSKVYLNGQLLGYRPSGFSSFCYDLTPYIKAHSDNVLAVRVDHSQSADSRWYTGSGIYRNVWLVSSGPTHFALWGNTWSVRKVTKGRATLQFDMEVEQPVNGLTAEVELLDADGRVIGTRKTAVGGSGKALLTMDVRQPRLWSLDTPYLYKARLRLLQDGREIDRDAMNVGIRTLKWDANRGFALNSQWMKVKGVCLHEDAGVWGNVASRPVWERRLRELKSIGVNAIRMSHNPHAPMFYELCDSLGLLVMDEASDEWEFPKRKWLKGWNVGKPGFQGTYDYFEQWIDRDVRDMVRRDRRHTSIFMWSIGNEVDYPNDPYSHPVLNGSSITQPMYGGYNPNAPHAERIGRIAKRLSAVVRAEDTSRPVTGALAGVVMSNETEYPAAVDVVGYNYTESRYSEDHQRYPKRIIYGSENRHDLPAWKAVRDNDYIFGQFLWTGIDYLGESGRWPARGSQPGLLDFGGFRKPLGWWRASLWSTAPVVYIGSYQIDSNAHRGRNRRDGNMAPSMYAEDLWNYEPGQTVRVVCYTNQPQARLLLNGKEVGAVQQKDDDTSIIYWDIPYESGTLVGEALDKSGKVVASYEIKSSGRPYALTAKLLDSRDRLSQIEVNVVDEQGIVVKLADNDVTCRISGNGRLLGMENSDNQDVTNKRDNHERVRLGRLLVYVENGTSVRFSSPLLQSYELKLK
ncbi:MAG: DUF4982 domain-containing protein [Prevotella sp.]|nr:DUF4982 domain-containing protein [Prevotella sp.]